jgi:ELWxxDGT repeat protein
MSALPIFLALAVWLTLSAGALAAIPANVRELLNIPLAPAAAADVATSRLVMEACSFDEGCEPGSWNFLTEQFPTRVADLDPGSASSSPQQFKANGSSVVFYTADSVALGNELYVMNRAYNDTWTAALLADVAPGPDSSDAASLTVFGSFLFFSAEVPNSGYGRELYAVEVVGSTPTAGLVADVYPGLNSSNPDNLVVFQGMLFFSANGGPDLGIEMFALVPATFLNSTRSSLGIPSAWWPAGSLAEPSSPFTSTYFVVRLVGDTIWPGPKGSEPYFITPLSNADNSLSLLYFGATAAPGNNSAGCALFACDCRPTTLVKQWYFEDLYDGTFSNSSKANATASASANSTYPSPSPIIALASVIESNATAIPLTGGAMPAFLTPVNKKYLYFSANTQALGRELWAAAITPGIPSAASGGAAGFNISSGVAFTTTALVADIYPGPQGSFPEELIAMASTNALYFTAYTQNEGFELHGLAPADANTLPAAHPAAIPPLFDLFEGQVTNSSSNTTTPNSSSPVNLIESAGSLIFSVADNGNGTAVSFILSQQPNGTPLPSYSSTPSATPTASVSQNYTITATSTPSISFSSSNTSTPSPIFSATGSLTPSATSNATFTPTSNATVSPSWSGTANASISYSGTGTRTASVSITLSASLTPSPITLSNTASLTYSVTRSYSSTETATASGSESATITASLSKGSTPSSSITASKTVSPSMAATSPVPTRSPDPTTSSRPTPLKSPTSSLTASATPSSGGFVPDSALIAGGADLNGPSSGSNNLALALGLGLGLPCLLCCAGGCFFMWKRRAGSAEAHSGLLVTKKKPGDRVRNKKPRTDDEDEEEEDRYAAVAKISQVLSPGNGSGNTSSSMLGNPISPSGRSPSRKALPRASSTSSNTAISGLGNAPDPFSPSAGGSAGRKSTFVQSKLMHSAFDEDEEEDNEEATSFGVGKQGRFSVTAVPISPLPRMPAPPVPRRPTSARNLAFAAGNRADLGLVAPSPRIAPSPRTVRPSAVAVNPLAASNPLAGSGPAGARRPSSRVKANINEIELASPRL